MLTFRKITAADVEAAVQIADEGKALLKSQNINQWQRGTYPDKVVFEGDVKDGIGYVVCDDDVVVAVCAVTFTPDLSYKNLTSGKWLTADDAVYATIHRSAVKADCRGRGVIQFLFEQVKNLAKQNNAVSIRIDTHEQNLSMQRAVQKGGFKYCGTLILAEGDEKGDGRLGYEVLL